MRFRKKPVEIDAVRTEIAVYIETLEGTMRAAPGDWIITGIKGERYPCKPDIFERTYEPVDHEPESNSDGWVIKANLIEDMWFMGLIGKDATWTCYQDKATVFAVRGAADDTASAVRLGEVVPAVKS